LEKAKETLANVQTIEELIEDYMELIDLREAKAAGQGQLSVSLDEVIKELKKG